MSGNRHSHLAMKAAKRIGSAKQKEKVGRTICYHLLMMIEEEGSAGPRYADRALRAKSSRLGRTSAFHHEANYQRQQFSLGL